MRKEVKKVHERVQYTGLPGPFGAPQALRRALAV